jgi:putative ABC transport system permease protein
VLRGHSFGASSDRDEPRPAVVSRSFADGVWRQQDPLGQQYRLPREARSYVVVGVAGDVKNGSFEQPFGRLAMYEARSPRSDISTFQSLIIRTESSSVEKSVRDVVRRMNPNVPVTEVETAEALIAGVNARVRFASVIMAVFATVAMLLALVGVYGAFWCAVSQRKREIGVRLALGAGPGNIVRMVLLSSGRVTLVGTTIGLALAFASTRVLQTLLFDVSPTDPATLIAVTALLVVAAIGASFVPARRASRIDPSVTFRTE